MGASVGGLDLYTGPKTLGATDDLDAVIREFIDDARHSLDLAVQEVDSRSIADSIIAARKRGVRVRLILEGDYLVERRPTTDPWATTGDFEDNRIIYAAMLRAGIRVVTDLNPAIFHQKFAVRDVGESRAALLTGSTNFTRTDTGTNPIVSGFSGGNNLNHVVVLHGKSAASQYLAEFERMWAGTFGELHERHEAQPREFTLGGMRIKPLFAPRHGPEMEIMKQMLKASQRIDFAMYTFAQSSGIDDTMIRLADGGLSIRGVLDSTQGGQVWAATQPLKASGAKLFVNTSGTGVRKVHHKLMVLDERVTIVGSFNYTGPATTLNDENIIVLGDLETTSDAADAAQRTIAHHALAEIDRIIDDLAQPL
jgi:phosphatidylserine/phosphatidylglycerophosphate/cardiolipin synthase-like enzyme